MPPIALTALFVLLFRLPLPQALFLLGFPCSLLSPELANCTARLWLNDLPPMCPLVLLAGSSRDNPPKLGGCDIFADCIIWPTIGAVWLGRRYVHNIGLFSNGLRSDARNYRRQLLRALPATLTWLQFAVCLRKTSVIGAQLLLQFCHSGQLSVRELYIKVDTAAL